MNKAALTAAVCGATWRTRYYAVRAKRLWEESQQGRIKIRHCPTKEMVTDGLTKLAAAEVLQMLLHAMAGNFPTRTAAHRTSVSPGPANRGDIAGDGPPQIPVELAHPGLPTDHPTWKELLEAMYRKWSSLHNVPRIPEILDKYEGNLPGLYAAFVDHHQLSNRELQEVIDEVRLKSRTSAGPPRRRTQATATSPPISATTSSTRPLGAATPQEAEEAKNKHDGQESEEQGSAAGEKQARKKRRGKKRCRPRSTERRSTALDRALEEAQEAEVEHTKSRHLERGIAQ